MMMLWKEKKEPVLLIDPNKKRFLTINSFDDKKVKKETNFFFLQKTPQNSLSNTLFNLSFSSREEKQNKKPIAALFYVLRKYLKWEHHLSVYSSEENTK